MNKRASPSLTWIVIGVVVFTGIMLLVYSSDYGIYNGLMEANGISIDSEYASAYDNLTINQASLTNLSDSMLEPGKIWSLFTNAGLELINTLSIGLSVINSLIAIPGFMISIVNTAA